MIDPKLFLSDFEGLKKSLSKKNQDPKILDQAAFLLKEQAELQTEVQKQKTERNALTEEIAKLKQNKAPLSEQEEKMRFVRELGQRIQDSDMRLTLLEEKTKEILLRIPNIPEESVPLGKSEKDNVCVKSIGTIPQFSFTPLDHLSLGEKLGGLDSNRAVLMATSRFMISYGAFAQLERALCQFMIDVHTQEHKYLEVNVPFLVNRSALTHTGNLPKFEEDLFKTGVSDKELFLIPTAEVPLTNLHQNEILTDLPRYYVASSACFRSEAGSYGKDTKGMIRTHQFQKVELMKFCDPESSNQELERMLLDAERILQKLGLAYRVMLLCTADMTFGSQKTYDIEVWIPSQNCYREISSCSHLGDFQARRGKIRFKRKATDKAQLVHTLNGSGLALSRTMVAVIENHQTEDGQVWVPEILHPYLKNSPYFTEKEGRLWMSKNSYFAK
jgi:seryl-tRNA synthetase